MEAQSHRRRGAGRGESGETLIELLASILLMSTAIIALLQAGAVMIRSADGSHRSVRAATEAASIAERIQAAPYVRCTTDPANNYLPLAGYEQPSGYTVTVTRADLRGRDSTTPEFGACPAADQGAQQLTVRVAWDRGQAVETVITVKRDPARPPVAGCP